MEETSVPEYDPISDFKVGSYIDAKDTVNSWCVAVIKEITETRITLGFDGWSNKWDETYYTQGYKVAPFRRFSHCYSGQTKVAIREAWTFSWEKVEEMQEKIEQISNSDLMLETAWDITQFYRGELFTWVDFLLVSSYSDAAEEERILKFFESTLKLIVAWLKALPDLVPDYILSIEKPTEFYTNKRVALVYAWPEMFFTLARLFEADLRTSGFFRLLFSDREPIDFANVSYVEESTVFDYGVLRLVEKFGELGGFDTLLQIAELEGKTRCPLEFLGEFPLGIIAEYFKETFARDFVPKYKDSILNRLNNVTTSELKQIDKAFYSKILNNLAQLMNCLTNAEENYEMVETLELNLALKFINCGLLEKRLRGINEIREFIDRVNYTPQPTYDAQLNPIIATKWLNPERLTQWIQQNDLLALLLEKYNHVEVIKRCPEIIKFMANQEALTSEHIDLIVDSISGKHDSIVRVVYKLIVEIAETLPQAQLDYVFNKLSSIPEWDEKLINTLKDFTFRANLPKIEIVPFAIPLFVEQIQDKSSLSDVLREQVLEALCDLLRSPGFDIVREQLLKSNLANFTQGVSVPQSLTLIMSIVDNWQEYKVEEQATRGEILTERNEEHELMSAAVENLLNYIKSPGESPYNYTTNISKRFEFISYVSHNTSFQLKVNMDLFTKLWNEFTKPSLTTERELFFKWLRKKSSYYSYRPYVLEPDLMEQVFYEFFCDDNLFPPANLTVSIFKSFIVFFEKVNTRKFKIEGNIRGRFKRSEDEVEGLDSLWEIALQAQDADVQKYAMALLVELHVSLDSSLSKEDIWTNFIASTFKQLSQEKDDHRIGALVEIIRLLLDRYEGKGSNRSATQISHYGSLPVILNLYKMDTAEHKSMQFNASNTIETLRGMIARIFKISEDEYDLKISNEKFLDPEYDHLTLNSYGMARQITIHKREAEQESSSPLEIISNTPANLDLLFSLLSHTDKPYASKAWSLLMRLPTNPKIKTQLHELADDWTTLLDSSSLHKLLYSLIIIEELIKSEADWLETFCEKDGPNELFKVFLEITPDKNLEFNLVSKFSTLILGLLNQIFTFTDTSELSIEAGAMVTQILNNLYNNVQSAVKTEEFTPTDFKAFVEEAKKLLVHFSTCADANIVRESIKAYQYLEELFLQSLIISKHDIINQSMVNVLVVVSFSEKIDLSDFFLVKLREFMSTAISSSTKSSCYFILTRHMIDRQPSLSNCDADIAMLSSALYEHSYEPTASEQDQVLTGIITLLNAYLKKGDATRISHQLVEYVMHDCLFDVPTTKEFTIPKTKHPNTRTAAFELLETMMNNKENMVPIMEFLDAFHKDPTWRTSKGIDWAISPASLEKSNTGFVGMKNLGCICYMISLLQQLFMTKNFRNAILDISDTSTPEDTPLEENMLYQLQYIYGSLQESARQYVNPKGMCSAFKDWDDQPINVLEQMDVEEFFNSFMDKLEGYIGGSKHANFIKNTFGGRSVTQMIGKGSCKHKSERQEPLLHLQVEVKNKKSILESLESYVEGELMEKDNAYQCYHCDAKVTALRRVCIKKLPNTLIIVLRRFEFNFDTMRKVKLNDYCEFPMEIDMEPYTEEGIERKERENEETFGQEFKKKYPDDYYQYKLKGVIIHMGTSDSGHYYSLITDRDGKEDEWFEFNDSIVRPFDLADMKSEAFGGTENFGYSTNAYSIMSNLREKYRNAYLLFYERDQFYDVSDPEATTLEPLVPTEPSNPPPKNVADIMAKVTEENERYWRSRNTFSLEYYNFLDHLWTAHQVNPGLKFDLFKFICSFQLTIMARSKDRASAVEILLKLRNSIDEQCAEWLIEVFCVRMVHRELLIDCPVSEVRKFIVILLKKAIGEVGAEFKLKLFLSMIKDLELCQPKYSRCYYQYLQLIYYLYAALVAQQVEIPHINPFEYFANHMFSLDKTFDEIPDPVLKNTDVYLGYDPTAEEETVIERGISHYMESSTSPTYLLRAITEAIDLEDSSQIELLTDDITMDKLITEAQQKVGIGAVCKLYIKLGSKDPEIVKKYVTRLLIQINKRDVYDLNSIIRQLRRTLVALSDDTLASCMVKFVQILKDNSIFYKATEICMPIFFKLCMQSGEALEWVKSHQEDWAWMITWSEDNILPPAYNSEISMYKKASAAQIGQIQARPNTERVQFLQALSQDEELKMQGYDSDQDTFDMEFQPDDILWALDGTENKYVQVCVDKVVDGMMNVKNIGNENMKRWIDRENDHIIPFQS